MKTLVIALSLITLTFLLTSTAEAAPERQKRDLWAENCPENTTLEQCSDYAKEKSKKGCHEGIISGTIIAWQGCGTLHCGENGKLIPGDPSKPYPDCCDQRCEIIDKSKPFEFSAVA